MGKYLTINQFETKANKKHNNFYRYFNDYIDSDTDVKIECPKHGIFHQQPNNHLQGKGCYDCYIEKSRLQQTDFINRLIEKYGNDKFDFSETIYVNMRTETTIKCKKHGTNITKIAKYIIGGVRCEECYLENRRNNFLEISTKVHENCYDYSEMNYINNSTDIRIICKKHGPFYQSPDNHTMGKGCWKCNISKSETFIEKYLNNKNIIFISQKRFDDCKYNKKLPFDFYLPEYNMCIEYNGEQHYKSVDFWGGEKDYEKRILRDKIKKQYCIKNNIKLLVIKYCDNIEEILERNFNI